MDNIATAPLETTISQDEQLRTTAHLYRLPESICACHRKENWVENFADND